VKARPTAARSDRLALTPSLTTLFPRQYSLLHTCARRHLVTEIMETSNCPGVVQWEGATCSGH
jgi:hypothetical protein